MSIGPCKSYNCLPEIEVSEYKIHAIESAMFVKIIHTAIHVWESHDMQDTLNVKIVH